MATQTNYYSNDFFKAYAGVTQSDGKFVSNEPPTRLNKNKGPYAEANRERVQTAAPADRKNRITVLEENSFTQKLKVSPLHSLFSRKTERLSRTIFRLQLRFRDRSLLAGLSFLSFQLPTAQISTITR